jgi:hypothetical protein
MPDAEADEIHRHDPVWAFRFLEGVSAGPWRSRPVD